MGELDMGKLVDIYTSIKNQNLLEDEELLKKIVLKYSKSGRTTLIGKWCLWFISKT